MASSSPSLVISQAQHDVFLSFRGEDTRSNFTSHLYAALCRKEIDTFIDDKKIQRGDELSPTLLAAIEGSKISIIIFSENYASSTWCLHELEKIIECNDRKRNIVIPVFYHIDPSHVRKQRGSYQAAFDKHEEDFEGGNLLKVQKWRLALHKAANSAGWDSSNYGLEADLVDKIVEDVLNKLNHMHPHASVSKGLVGISKHIARIESLICLGSTNVRIIGIWGMGGLGKTTIAEVLFKKLSSQYKGRCFLANVRERWKNGRKNDLQNELLTRVLGDQNLHISTPSISSTFVTNRLQRRKLLIVLDDVNDSDQIEYLVGEKDRLGPGSIIIVTTRNKDVFHKGVDGLYQVVALNWHKALQLFCLNAFGQDHPTRGYTHLSERAVDYAKGVPLALKVLGSSLYSKSPKEWKSTLEKLENMPHQKIHPVLCLSYEELDLEVQNIFLDIACSLKGETRSRIISLLDGCGFSTDIGIRCLEDRSLLTVSKDDKVQMHDLIQEMGWQIVRQESMKEPGKRSRLWNPRDIHHVLKYNSGTDSVESMVLDMSLIKDVQLRPQTFSKMHRLRLLKFYMPSYNKKCNLHISRGLESLPDELIYFRWDCFPLKSLPPSFCAEKLVELNLKDSGIQKLWDGVQDLVNLKSLYLIDCKQLIDLPDLSKATNLSHLFVSGCKRLKSLPNNFCAENLVTIHLRDSHLEKLWDGVQNLVKLKVIDLSESKYLTELPDFSKASNLEQLILSECTSLCELHPSILYLPKVVELYLDSCKAIKNLEEVLVKFLEKSKRKYISELNWMAIEKTPSLKSLTELNVSGSNIESLPTTIQDLSRPRILRLRSCRRLRSLPELPPSIEQLDASGCISLEIVLGWSVELESNNKCWSSFENCIKFNEQSLERIMSNALVEMEQAAYVQQLQLEKQEKLHEEEEQEMSDEEEEEQNILSEEEEEQEIPDEGEEDMYRSILLRLPGNKLPDWDGLIKTTEASITLKLASPSNLMDFLCFCVLSQGRELFNSVAWTCDFETGNSKRVCIVDGTLDGPTIVLYHEKAFSMDIMGKISKSNVKNPRLSFQCSLWITRTGIKWEAAKVEEWGVLPIYACDILTSRL